MFNISNKHEEFFDYLIDNAEIFGSITKPVGFE